MNHPKTGPSVLRCRQLQRGGRIKRAASTIPPDRLKASAWPRSSAPHRNKWGTTTDAYLPLYRRQTEHILQQYFRMSFEVGKVPSCMPTVALRTRGQSTPQAPTFEDCIIFVYDIERCLKELTPSQFAILEKVALHDYTRREASRLLGIPQGSVAHVYNLALDSLTIVLRERNLIPEEM